MLVATRVGGILADVAALVAHLDVADLDGGAGQVGGVDQEADPALHGRVRVVGLKFWVQYSNVDPLSILGLIDPSDLQAEGDPVLKCVEKGAHLPAALGNTEEHFEQSTCAVIFAPQGSAHSITIKEVKRE